MAIETRDLTERRVLGVVSELVSELRGASAGLVSLDDMLDRDLGIGSLERVELLVRLERTFGRRLADHVMVDAERPADLVAALRTTEQGTVTRAADERASPLEAAIGSPGQARSLVEVLRWRVDATPNRQHVMLQEDDGRERLITYAELWEQAGRIAGALQARNIGRRATVALMLRTEADFFFTFFGTLLAGAVPVPIYPPFRADRIEEFATRQAAILQNADARLLVTFDRAERLAGLLRSHAPALESVVSADELKRDVGARATPHAAADDPALIQYTSGSTGMPKGVLLSHANLLANIRAIGQAFRIQPDDAVVSWLPLYHDMGLIGAWLGALYYGLPLAVLSPFAFLSRPSRWLWMIHRYAGTLSPAPNFAYDLCVTKIPDEELEGLDVSTWRVALNGSEPVNPETIARFAHRFGPYGFRAEAMCPVYGLAECSVGLSASKVGQQPRIDRVERDAFERYRVARPASTADADTLQFVSCGFALPGHDVRVVDAVNRGRRPVSERAIGCVEFRGPSAMQGYYRNLESTEAIRHDGWLITGDLGYVADGEIFITGREKDIVIFGGRNLYPQEIEELAAQVAGIRRGCVAAFGVTDAGVGTERLVVVAETREIDPVRREALRTAVRDTITAAVGVPPHTIVIADPGAVLKTSSGKIRRKDTREAYVLGRRRPSAGVQWVRLVLKDLGGRMRRTGQGILDGGYTGYVGMVFGMTALPLWKLLWLLPAGPTCERLVRRCARLMIALSGCPVTVAGLDQARGCGPAILLANHASYIDVVILMAALPLEFRFVAKRGLMRYPLLGTVIRKMKCLTIERADISGQLAGADQVIEALRRGERLFIFPEGTFVAPPGLRPFRLGAFRAAVEAGTPVIPIALAGTRAILPADRRTFRRGRVTVTVRPPIRPDGEGWPAIVRLRDRARSEISKYCGEV